MNNPAARSDLALFLLCVAIWSSTWIAITFQLGRVEPEASVFYRFLLASILLFGWCRLRGLQLRFDVRQHLALAFQGTLMFGVSYLFVYRAETLVVSGLVALGFSATPLVNMLGARLAFRTPITRRIALGAGLGTIGILFVFAPEIATVSGDTRTLRGAWYTALAVLTSAAGSLSASRNARIGIRVEQAMAWGMLYGSACSLLATLLSGKSLGFEWSVPYLASLMYLAVFGSVIAFAAYLTLLHRIGPARTGYIGVAIPIVALVISALAEDFTWRWETCAGLVLAIAGNVIILRRA